MSGPRPTNLTRRGAVYAVRLRLPSDLARAFGFAELRKSLHTKDIETAKVRCRRAVAWFHEMTDQLRSMPTPTRGQLEAAARRYFSNLQEEIDLRSPVSEEDFEAHLPLNLELTRQAREERETSLQTNSFGKGTELKARELVRWVGGSFDDLDPATRVFALQLIARSERQQMRYLEHVLTVPHLRFEVDDGALSGSPNEVPASAERTFEPRSGINLTQAGEQYLARKKMSGVGKSHVDELARAIGWLKEEFGDARLLSSITPEEMRDVRDGIERRDVRLQGRATPFRDSRTDAPEHQIKAVTAKRYWTSIQQFFDWAVDERHLSKSPGSGFKITPRRNQRPESPPAFSEEELRKLFRTPLYEGRRPKQPTVEGQYIGRDGRWWSAVLALFTGLRAGEIAQLLPSDFSFDGPTAFVSVSELNAEGLRVKTAKTISSIRDVPISSRLLTLGLREFVEARAKIAPSERVFLEFRLGVGRASDGLTKFWGAYLKKFGLWKPGRSTHVMRHTVVARLRELGVPEEDIGSIVGHAPTSQTGRYGGGYSLKRKAEIIERLDYGFDIVTVLGGPYDPKRHR